MEYTFEHPKTGEKRTVTQAMTEEHVYEEGGVQWNRVFYPPRFSIGDTLDPYSADSFKKYTDRRKGTVGDLWQLSGELSEKRKAQNGGIDPVKANYAKEKGLPLVD